MTPSSTKGCKVFVVIEYLCAAMIKFTRKRLVVQVAVPSFL